MHHEKIRRGCAGRSVRRRFGERRVREARLLQAVSLLQKLAVLLRKHFELLRSGRHLLCPGRDVLRAGGKLLCTRARLLRSRGKRNRPRARHRRTAWDPLRRGPRSRAAGEVAAGVVRMLCFRRRLNSSARFCDSFGLQLHCGRTLASIVSPEWGEIR